MCLFCVAIYVTGVNSLTAVVQVQATDNRSINIGGRIAYALWRSVYAVKQVDVRNRVRRFARESAFCWYVWSG